MASIGEMLRATREAQGRSVADLATELCITDRYLRALEEDDIKTLPGLFFYQSFVRQYAGMLGMDARQINDKLSSIAGTAEPVAAASDASSQTFDLAEFRDLSHARVVSRSLRVRTTTPSPGAALLERMSDRAHRMSIAGYPAGVSTAALVGALILGAGIFAWWNHTPQTRVSVTSSAPKTAKAAPAGTNASLQNGALQNAAMQTADDPNEVVLSFSATEETWLSITSHGKVIFSGILQPSESRTLKGGEVATMKIGNAGGVDIQWNGKSIGPIGPRGQVRTVRFTRQDFRVISPEDQQSSDSETRHDL